MSNASQPPYPPEFQEKLEHMQRISLDIRTLVNRHQQFETQLNENQMVKEELDALKDDDSVYKMHGKVLIRQDLTEAKGIVNSRIQLIQTEIEKIDKSIKENTEKRDKLQRDLADIAAKTRSKA